MAESGRVSIGRVFVLGKMAFFFVSQSRKGEISMGEWSETIPSQLVLSYCATVLRRPSTAVGRG